jgi:hypothetical protein
VLLQMPSYTKQTQAQTQARTHPQTAEEDNLYMLIHPSFSEVYLNIKTLNNLYYLSLSDVLTLFEIPFRTVRDSAERICNISSGHQEPPKWSVDIRNASYFIDKTKTRLAQNDFLQDTTAIYLKLDLYDSLFHLKWSLNHSSMAIGFNSDEELPFQSRARREWARRQLPSGSVISHSSGHEAYPERKRQWFGTGALDYRYSIDYSANGRMIEGRLHGGIELLGGDLAGSLVMQQTKLGGLMSQQLTNWRFVTARGSSEHYSLAPAQVLIGRPAISGTTGETMKGIYVSNSNIMPRQTLGSNLLEGQTVPLSDVDLWFSGRLIDYTTADSSGRFNFRLPLNYGQSRVELRIYTPDGREFTEHRQLNLPFAFLPPGQCNYYLQLGQTDRSPGKWMSNGELNIGFTPELAARIGMQTLTDSMGYRLKSNGSIHARILQQYLLNLATDERGNSRMSLGTIFPNRMSTTITYDHFGGLGKVVSDQILPQQGQRIQIQHIMPLSLKQRPLGFRIEGEYTNTALGRKFNLSADALWNQGPFTNRAHFKTSGTKGSGANDANDQWEKFNEMTLQTVFVVPRWKFVPRFVQGLNFRASLTTDFQKTTTQSSTGGQLRFSAAKNIGRTGRLQINASRPIRGEGTLVGLNIQYDLKPLRTSTDWGTQFGSDVPQTYLRHSGTGSLIWDAATGKPHLTSAEQVGRAGLTVRFFMDENENKRYDPGELIMPVPSARLDKSYSGQLGNDNLLRFLQLQSYWRYELQIDENTLPEADLVSLTSRYPFVACPNQMHSIDVPLYRAGSVSGEVLQKLSAQTRPLGGLRILISSTDLDSRHFNTSIRSYADGSFYLDRLRPGVYCLKLDQQQLDFLGGRAFPDSIVLEIRARIEGHHHENLQFNILPELPNNENLRARPLFVTEYRRRLEDRARLCVAAFIDAQHRFYGEEWIRSLNMIDSSLALFPSDYGIALRGSALFVQGDTMQAYQLWKLASSRNPFLTLPKMSRQFDSLLSELNRNQSRELDPVFAIQLKNPVPGMKLDTTDLSKKEDAELRRVFQSRARIAVSSFVETQELLYRGCNQEALDMLDYSLRLFTSDYGLALRGTISFLMGQRSEAHKFWTMALERNPFVQFTDPAFLNQLITSSGQNSNQP